MQTWILSEDIDGGADTPIFHIFEHLAAEYPDAKFIYVQRNIQDWIDAFKHKKLVELHSRFLNMGREKARLDPNSAIGVWCYAEVFGRKPLTDDILALKFEEHKERVRRFFTDKPERLLSITLDNLRWQPLCQFLNLPIPTEKFPHLNSRCLQE